MRNNIQKTMKTMMVLCLVFSFSGMISAQTLSIGDYESIEEWGDYGGNLYDGSVWECVPINLTYTNSGTQIILTKEELAEMAGKNITSISFIPHDGGSYQEINYNVKVYLAETNRTSFFRNSSNRYKYFEISRATKLADCSVTHDGYTYSYCDCAPIELVFDTPFYYSGNNNLVVTIMADDADDETPGIDYVNFYQSDLPNRAITFSSSTKKLSDVLATEGYAERYGVSVLNAPICQFGYETASQPAAKWFSYVPTSDEDLDIVGFDAYQIKSVAGSAAQLTRVKQAKKNTPLIVCQNITPTISPSDGTLDVVASNLLKVSDGTITGASNIYALAEKGGVTAFYRVNPAVTIPAGKVYLETSSAANEVIFIDGNDADGIENIAVNNETTTADWFTIDGRRLDGEPTSHGLYILSGKKVMR